MTRLSLGHIITFWLVIALLMAFCVGCWAVVFWLLGVVG